MMENRLETVTFGDYELDMVTRQLRYQNEPVALQPRVLDLLAFLVRERHRAVDKDAIQDEVWSGTIVSETALTRAIMKARRAVGDSADKQAVIRTIHGHGYQFVATVDEAVDSEQHQAPLNDENHSSPELKNGTNPAQSTAQDLVQTDSSTVPEIQVTEHPPSTPSQQTQSKGSTWVLVAALAAVVLSAAWFWQTDKQIDSVRVAVLPVHNASQSEELNWVKLGLLGFANDMLKSSTDIDIVPASEIVSFAENNQWNERANAEHAASQIKKLRTSYGASHVLFSEVKPTVGGLRLNYSLFGQKGEIKHATMVGDQATDLVRGMIRDINEALTPRNYLKQSTELNEDDPFINEAYARGMNFALSGQCTDALPLFQIVKDRAQAHYNARFQWSACARILGKTDEAEEAFKTLIEELNDDEHGSMKSAALAGLGALYHRSGRLKLASQALEQGLNVAQKSNDSAAEGKILNGKALIAKDQREFDKAKELLAKAVVAYRQTEREILPGQIYSALANIAMAEGNFDIAEDHLQQALKNFRSLGDRRFEAMMLNNYGYLKRRQGHIAESEPLHLESLKIRQEIGDKVGQGRILGMLSTLYEEEHRYEDARDAATKAVVIATEANDTLFMGTGNAQLAAAELSLGSVDAARAHYLEALELFQQLEDHSRSAQVELRLVNIDVTTENLKEAQRRLNGVLAHSLENGLNEPAIEAYEQAAEIAQLEDESMKAAEHYLAALNLMQESGLMDHQTRVRIKLGHLYLDDKDLLAAEPQLGYVISEEPTADSLKFHARYTFMQGNTQRSITLLESAKELSPIDWTHEDQSKLTNYRNSITAATTNN